MIEVLVALLVLSFGVLGMVGMQAAALQSNRDARLQSTALLLARELADMMRGNKSVSTVINGNPYHGSFASPMTPSQASYCLNIASSTTVCKDTTDVANAQMTEWLSRVDAELPQARVEICLDSQPFETINGLPQWKCTKGSEAVTTIKLGWTRSSLNRGAVGTAALERAMDTGARPLIVVPVIPGI